MKCPLKKTGTMKKIAVFLLLILSASVFASGCLGSSPPQPEANTVSIKNFAFAPSTITVSAGTAVTWKNEDGAAHTVTSDTGAFDSGSIPSGQTFTHTFKAAGTYNYSCSIHKYMKGTLIVQ